jgi:hypothetical protein
MGRSRVEEPSFDAQGLLDQDYLHFYAEVLGEERSEAETELLWWEPSSPD